MVKCITYFFAFHRIARLFRFICGPQIHSTPTKDGENAGHGGQNMINFAI